MVGQCATQMGFLGGCGKLSGSLILFMDSHNQLAGLSIAAASMRWFPEIVELIFLGVPRLLSAAGYTTAPTTASMLPQ